MPLDPLARRVAAVLVLGGFMVVLDTTVTVVALAALARDLDASISAVQWATTAYTLALVAVIPLAAWATARLGSRGTYVLAVVVFTLGSVLAAAAWDVGTLVAARVVQGLGGGLINPVGMAIALRTVAAGQRGRMMSLFGVPVLIAPLVGPVLGGWLIDTLSWRWIFLINVPVGLAVIACRRWLVADGQGAAAPLDVVGLALLAPGAAALAYGVTAIGDAGRLTAGGTVPAAVGAVMVAAFVPWSLRHRSPLLRLRLLRERALAAGLATVAPFGAAYFGAMFVLPLYWQVVRGEGATFAGAVGIPQVLATGLTMQVATRLVDRVPPRRIVVAGIATALTGQLLMLAQLTATAPVAGLMAAGAVTGVGVGATLMPAMTGATRDLPHDDIPSGSTILAINQQLAVSLGVAAVSALLTALVATRAPVLGAGGLGAATDLDPAARLALAPDLAAALQLTLVLPVGLTALSLAVAVTALRTAPPVAAR
ncbi:DHA2 family efflux MFS transporter permease subunit [Pseudonocardia abyssalis]|uniref:DHA2 family efflux MFS transporter permease subunit n=1 Tax=Pseudonocardia abyssalis TaxID=2792008 RepID=A0ABS6UKL8_9PSEU|nr:DHA2 family efflux MFS transporter permease subunit [Pseudonocardia abyssalis]MBW0116181.1 DHA2 family efflux MFS transporter permease subunit [Pseudonocardia abyssalis]MBW0132774.1 DHA2 family efflux MFS transporter permease subunit [Pseudonocardia abyssalis]